ncbi:MAG TPA: hypothetical protein VKA70_11175 [Blastocatellia bacterium]|nr:hypothetical protein [Blastocatellia bacterium]
MKIHLPLISIALIICLAGSALGQASDDRNKTAPMFRSTDGGASWTAINTGIVAHFISALAIDPRAPEIVYAGSDRGIFKTTDGGNNWAVPNGDITLFTIESIVIDPITRSTLYAGAFGGGAYKSTDGGATWSRINNGLGARKIIRKIIIDPVNTSVLYMAADSEVFKSSDAGASWVSALKLPATGDRLFPQDLLLDPRNPSTVYVIGSGKIFKSTDAGNTWKEITGQIAIPQYLGIDPINTSTLYILNFNDAVGLFRSTDGGTSWTGGPLINSSLPPRTAVFQLVIDPATPSTLYLATFLGVFKSTDGGSNWAETGLAIDNGFPANVFSLDINPVNPSILYAGTGGGASANDGSPWITGVSVDGKKLEVTGENFDSGAVILLDGEPQKTANDLESPTRALVGKKSGKKVKKRPESAIQIRNANGKLSQTVVRPVD